MKTILEMIKDHDSISPTPEELILGILLKEQPENVVQNLEFCEKNKGKITRLVKF